MVKRDGEIRTTHVGRLGHPDELRQRMTAAQGRPVNDPQFARQLRDAAAHIVRDQGELANAAKRPVART